MKGLLKFSLVLLIVGVAGGFLFVTYLAVDLPDVSQITNRKINESTKIYNREGDVLLYEIHGEEKRTVVAFEDIPDIVKEATLAAEDINFYKHPAFDWRALVRAAFIDLVYNKRVGGSTITQQLAKNVFLSGDKTITRKIRELILAIKLEREYSKDEILNLYLNQIPYGGNAYGIEAAAQTYFNKQAKDLTLGETAVLVALPQAPSYYSPYGSHTDDLYKRRDYVLNQMRDSSFINKEEVGSAKEEELIFAPQATTIKAPHFVMMVVDYLRDKYGEDMVQNGGLRVVTTLDYDLQEKAEKIIKEGADRNYELYKGRNAALVAQEAKTGQILSLVGSYDYFDIENEGNFNVAAQGLRQPGSSFKPIAYLTAFSKGYTPETILFDVPTEFDTTGGPESSYSPGNFDHIYRGPVSMRNSLAQSVNVTAVKTLYLAGIDDTLKTAADLGITTLTDRSRFGLSLVLGGGEVRLTELVGAYAVLARDGEKHEQVIVLEVKDRKGKILEEWREQREQVFEAQYVREINNVLSDTKARSGLFSASLGLTIFPGYEVALKTGTTNDYVDAWTVGYSPNIVVGVWAGNNRREPMEQRGSSLLAALPIWNSFFKEAVIKYEPESFIKPDKTQTNKPILRGDYLYGNNIHNILYYVDKNNPTGPLPSNLERDIQFSGWEKSVIEWAKNNLPDFPQYNKQPIYNYVIDNKGVTVNIEAPKSGDFVKDINELKVKVESESPIKEIITYFNGREIDRREVGFGQIYDYIFPLKGVSYELQNEIKVTVRTESGSSGEAKVIVFR